MIGPVLAPAGGLKGKNYFVPLPLCVAAEIRVVGKHCCK